MFNNVGGIVFFYFLDLFKMWAFGYRTLKRFMFSINFSPAQF